MQITKEYLETILKQIKQNHPECYILMSPNSIGELLYTCGFAKSFRNQYQSPIVMCVRPEHVQLVEKLYPNRFKAIIPLHMEVMRAFITKGIVPYGYFGKDYPLVLSPLHYENGRISQLKNLLITRFGTSGLSSTDAARYMLHLDWDARIEQPNMEWVFEFGEKFTNAGINLDNFALIQLGNNTNKPLPSHFYSCLEQKLSEKGLQVLANAAGSMLIPQNLNLTRSISVQADALSALALMKYSTLTVTGNNGLALFAWCTKALNGKSSETHVITSNMYCEHYNLLRSDWEKAFVQRDTELSLWQCIPELIVEPDNFYEWFGDCNSSNEEYEMLAANMIEKDLTSKFFMAPPSEHHFPEMDEFDKNF